MAKAQTSAAAKAAKAATEADHAEAREQAQHMRQMATEGGGTGGTATIFRLDVGPLKVEEYLETVATSLMWDEPHEYLRQHFGGGHYRVVLKDSERRFIPGMSHLKYILAGPPKAPAVETPETRRLDELQDKLDKALKGGGGDMSSADMVRALLEISREQLRELRNPPAAAAAGNPAEMAVNLVASLQAAQAPLLAALIDRASAPAPDTTAQLKGMMEMFTMMRELTGEGSKSGWDAIAGKLADPLGALVGQHIENQRNGSAPASTMPRLNPPTPDQSMANRPAWYPFLAPYLPQLLQFAAQGRDPVTTADFLADGIPDEQIGAIYQALSPPTFLDELRHHVPETAHSAEWFGAFVARILEWVTYTEPEAPPAPVAQAPEVGHVARGTKPE